MNAVPDCALICLLGVLWCQRKSARGSCQRSLFRGQEDDGKGTCFDAKT